MDDLLLISYLNDFIFCPASIYFHQLYGNREKMTYQCSDQINGTAARAAVDSGRYSTRKTVFQSIFIYSEQLKVVGRIDTYDAEKEVITERKKKIKQIFDGYIFQLYAQYYCLCEMGYTVRKLQLYSMDDNKMYPVALPENDLEMKRKFENLFDEIKHFSLVDFYQTNSKKCAHCIYEPACDRSLL